MSHKLFREADLGIKEIGHLELYGPRQFVHSSKYVQAGGQCMGVISPGSGMRFAKTNDFTVATHRMHSIVQVLPGNRRMRPENSKYPGDSAAGNLDRCCGSDVQ